MCVASSLNNRYMRSISVYGFAKKKEAYPAQDSFHSRTETLCCKTDSGHQNCLLAPWAPDDHSAKLIVGVAGRVSLGLRFVEFPSNSHPDLPLPYKKLRGFRFNPMIG